MAYRFGIDAGSKTIKVVIVDDDGKIERSIYRRHRFDIRTTVREAIHDLAWRYGDLEGTIGITGSAGIGLADVLGLPFIQEVVATTHAVQSSYPEADAIIELGGEDAKIVYLTDGLEQRMNATCAGGTGGFIDTIAFMTTQQTATEAVLPARVAEGLRAESTPPRVEAPAPEAVVKAARDGSIAAFEGLDQADADTVRMHINDVCFVLSAYAGRAIRIVAAAPDLARLVVPHACESCVLDGLERVIERACGHAPEIAWSQLGAGCSNEGADSADTLEAERQAPGRECAGRGTSPARDGEQHVHERPRIGLIGAAPLVFDPFMNDGLAAFIEESGCSVVFPDKSLLETDDVRYLPQLDIFSQAGVDHIIYLVSFGCLKGHVSARGALRSLARRYPDMPITIIDYDPEASALNRENRVRLALEAARRQVMAARRPR